MNLRNRLRWPALLAVAAMSFSACGDDAPSATTAAPPETTEMITAPPVAQGTGELVVSDGNTYELAIDGSCEVADEGAVTFTATADDVSVAVATTGGFGTLFMSGAFEAEGRVEHLQVVDGLVSANGIVTEADDTALPLEFELTAHCG